ncbi:carboxypeptidase-like regulatory domain-containing protein [Paenibacillus xylaniclasticus]|uniref:carboxypeptidase-like regulatory domain-containing protein n=1 Tax=Paenibacillus xylaniclasticus TaxID=588083 RepID=UPI000FD9B756|nr:MULTISPECIES: carboxypeptidase-like regulatory domain-containing protein [Paenibacillus]GFN30014.1 hypothetical protein PCURB6_02740 [Paenibacillus curdlanolyticus]
MSGMMKPSFAGQPELLRTVVSAAVRPYDTLSPSGSLIGDVTVRLVAVEKPPIRNRSGWYVYTGLMSGVYTVQVESQHYISVEQTLTVPLSTDALPVTVDVPLLPKPSYPFASHVTLIRAIVRLPSDRAVEGADVRAELFEPDSSYTAALASAAEPDTTRIKLAGIGLDGLQSGSVLLLKNTQSSRLEYVRLASPIPANAAAEGYPLTAPIRYPHPAGTAVYAVKLLNQYEVRTDLRGEIAIPFLRLPLSRGFVALTVSKDGYSTINRDIQCEEGRTASLGVLTLLSI